MIEFQFNAEGVDKYFRATEKAIDLSTKFAMNKAIAKAEKIAGQEFEERRGITESSEIKFSDLIDTKKVTLRNIRNVMNARLDAEYGTRTGLLNYLIGKRSTQKLRGKPFDMRNRTNVRFANINEHPNSFIERPKSGGKPQVFSRGVFGGKERVFRQTVEDAHSFVTRERTQKEMEMKAIEEAETSFYKHLDRQLEKLNREPLTIREQKARGYK